MTNLFGEPYSPKKKKPVNKTRRNWENRFQRWSNNQSQDGYTSIGICGYSDICDYCKDNTYGHPCVRALNAMIKEKQLKIDYSNADFFNIWSGNYWKKEREK